MAGGLNRRSRRLRNTFGDSTDCPPDILAPIPKRISCAIYCLLMLRYFGIWQFSSNNASIVVLFKYADANWRRNTAWIYINYVAAQST